MILGHFKKIFLQLHGSASNGKKFQELFAVYARLEKQIRKFQGASKLHCKSGCGQCCENPHVETTVFEMMPLAHDLWKKNQAQEILKKIDDERKGVCVFYAADPSGTGQGRCTVYSLRPLICRLFGFSAKTDKTGAPQFVTCKVIKTCQAKEYARAEEMIQGGLEIPIMADFAREVARIDPSEGVRQLPINTALKQALEKVGLRRKLSAES
jgi:Fe-S-cluster containining protein